jgi:hypothetical protein
MIVRFRQNKRPMPSRAEMRTMASSVRNRLTIRHAAQQEDNALYESLQQTVRFGPAQKVVIVSSKLLQYF